MTLESIEFRRPTVSKSSRKPKSMIVFGTIVLTIILAFGIATGLSTGPPSSPTKFPNCTNKVLELAQNGIARDIGGDLWSNLPVDSHAWFEFSIW